MAQPSNVEQSARDMFGKVAAFIEGELTGEKQIILSFLILFFDWLK